MGKKKKSSNKTVFYLSSTENTLRQMPHYNPYQTGHGAHGSKKYNRRKIKEQFKRELGNEAL